MYGIDEWLTALESAGSRPRERGGRWSARCPAHDDSNPSLGLTVAPSGTVLVTCYAGCDFTAIRSALFGDNHARPSAPAATSQPKRPRVRAELPPGEHYRYTDSAGGPRLVVVRGEGKRFTQWRRHPDGWEARGLDGELPLFGLDLLAAAPLDASVLVVEGEKDVLAAREAWPTQTTTCWPGGANSWERVDWTPLQQRRVTLLADADDPGRDAMRGIAAILSGLECEVLVALPDGDTGLDLSDLLGAVGPQRAATRILELRQPWEVAREEPDEELARIAAGIEGYDESPEAPRAPLVPGGLIYARGLTLITAQRGVGKTTYCAWQAARAEGEGHRVLVLDDDDRTTWRAMLARFGASGAGVVRHRGGMHAIPHDRFVDTVLLLGVDVVFVDSWQRLAAAWGVMDHGGFNQTEGMLWVIEPLRQAAEDHGCAIVILTNPSKGETKTARGSLGLPEAVDVERSLEVDMSARTTRVYSPDEVKARDGIARDAGVWRLDDDGGAFQQAAGPYTEESVAPGVDPAVLQAVLDAILGASPEPLNVTAIKKLVARRGEKVPPALAALVVDGAIKERPGKSNERLFSIAGMGKEEEA